MLKMYPNFKRSYLCCFRRVRFLVTKQRVLRTYNDDFLYITDFEYFFRFMNSFTARFVCCVHRNMVVLKLS